MLLWNWFCVLIYARFNCLEKIEAFDWLKLVNFQIQIILKENVIKRDEKYCSLSIL